MYVQTQRKKHSGVDLHMTVHTLAKTRVTFTKEKLSDSVLSVAELLENHFCTQVKFLISYQSVFSEQNWTLSSKKECLVLNTGR